MGGVYMKTKIIFAPKKHKIKAADDFTFRLEQGVLAALREQGLLSRAQYEESLAICGKNHGKSGDVNEW